MTAILERRFSPAARWSRRLGAFSAMLFVVSGLSHRFGLLETVPFLWLLGLSGFLALSGLLFAVAGFVQIWEHGLLGLKAAGLGALFSVLVLLPYAVSTYRFAVHPPLVDISTDISRPPQFRRAAALRTPPMNALRPGRQEDSLLQQEAYPQLSGRRYEHARESVMEAVSALIAARRWRPLEPMPPAAGSSSITVEVVAHSFLLGFLSDVAIRIEDRGNATYVDMRSASRYGRHDMGDNAQRITRFLNDLDRRMEALSDLSGGE
ncbi:DUF1499 domain-containing protein [Chelativorans xinjiangense]|uniref:DUF1499 domain-containing protein n=1 Tax=Chelativorans xinjiangense TaxID=2681485 RepID=UPI0013576138|nr:DUF1499 domain-containing protein [Chelativorans xinjiangense]